MIHPARRFTDQRYVVRLRRAVVAVARWAYGRAADFGAKTLELLNADIRMVLFLAGWGLIAWASMGVYTERGWHDLVAYASMFPMGSPMAWIMIYYSVGASMIWLALNDVPKVPALLLGPVLIAVWSWAFFARTATVATYQTGNATSLIYMAIGTLLVYNAGSRK